jgi:hypothetical protein
MTQEGTHIILHKETGKYFERAIVLGVDDLWQEVVVEEAEEGAGGEDPGPEAAPERPVASQQVQAGPFHPLTDQSCTSSVDEISVCRGYFLRDHENF